MTAAINELRQFLSRTAPGRFLVDEPLAAHTWYRIGGPADLFFFPSGVEDLCDACSRCTSLGLPFFIIGEGANILASDAGFRGLVINLARGFGSLRVEGDCVHAGAGVPLRAAVCAGEAHSLAGLSGLTGIPGSVGGALIMNAGTDAGEIGAAVESVDALDGSYRPVTLRRGEIEFSYRSAPQLQDLLLLGCRLKLRPGNAADLREERLALLRRRAEKQPLEFPSCGSVFKRPPGHFVGRMVEEAGLKGLRHGDAMVSPRHGGFIVNLGTATAQDVMWLIEKVKDEIRGRFGVDLETEVRLLGF